MFVFYNNVLMQTFIFNIVNHIVSLMTILSDQVEPLYHIADKP